MTRQNDGMADDALSSADELELLRRRDIQAERERNAAMNRLRRGEYGKVKTGSSRLVTREQADRLPPRSPEEREAEMAAKVAALPEHAWDRPSWLEPRAELAEARSRLDALRSAGEW